MSGSSGKRLTKHRASFGIRVGVFDGQDPRHDLPITVPGLENKLKSIGGVEDIPASTAYTENSITKSGGSGLSHGSHVAVAPGWRQFAAHCDIGKRRSIKRTIVMRRDGESHIDGWRHGNGISTDQGPIVPVG